MTNYCQYINKAAPQVCTVLLLFSLETNSDEELLSNIKYLLYQLFHKKIPNTNYLIRDDMELCSLMQGE